MEGQADGVLQGENMAGGDGVGHGAAQRFEREGLHAVGAQRGRHRVAVVIVDAEGDRARPFRHVSLSHASAVLQKVEAAAQPVVGADAIEEGDEHAVHTGERAGERRSEGRCADETVASGGDHLEARNGAQGLVAEDDLAVHESEGLVDRCHRLTVVLAAVRLEERLL